MSSNATIGAAAVSGTAATSRLALIALLVGAAAMGGSGLWVKLSELGPSTTGFYRMALAVPVFWLATGLSTRRGGTAARPAGARDYALLIAAGLFFAGDIISWHWALRYTTVANATLLGNFAPIFVTFGAWLLFGERATPVLLLGLALALIGAALLMGGSLALSEGRIWGDALSLVTAAFYGGYLLTIARLRRRFSTATIMTWSTAASALAILPVALASESGFVPPTLYAWGIVVGFALVSQTSGQGLVAYALAHLPASFSSVALLVQPLAAAILAWIILGEAVGPIQAAGGAAVLAGIVLARRGSRRG